MHDTGSLLVSNAAPGLFPPFCHAEGFLVDGVFLNNVPVDVMTKMNPSGSVIGIDVNLKDDLLTETTYTDGLSGLKILLSRLNPFKPSIKVSTIIETLLRVSSIVGLAQAERNRNRLADLYIQPPVSKFSLMEIKKAEAIAKVGYNCALPILKNGNKKNCLWKNKSSAISSNTILYYLVFWKLHQLIHKNVFKNQYLSFCMSNDDTVKSSEIQFCR